MRTCSTALPRVPHTARLPLRGAAVALVALGIAACAGAPLPAPTVQRAPFPPPSLPAPSGARTAAPRAAPAEKLADPADGPAHLVRQVLEKRAARLDPLAREGIAHVLAKAEVHEGLPVLMVLALIEQESHFDPHALGPRGARGLMQIRPFVARDVAHRAGWRFEKRMLRDPVENVRLGVRYLVELRKRFGTPKLALAAYNAGPSRVEQRIARGRRPYGPYVRRVLALYAQMREEYGAQEAASGG